MKRPVRLYGLAILAAAGFGFTAILVAGNKFLDFDLRVIQTVQSWETPGLTRLMETFTKLGTARPIIVILLAIAAYLVIALREWKPWILLAAAVGGSPLLGSAVKALFRRERPDIHRLAEEAGYSFPSIHALSAIVLYGLMFYLLWRHIRSLAGRAALAAFCLIMITGISLSRIYLGVHYPSDIIGGLLLGAAWLFLAVGIYENGMRRKGERA